MAFELPVLEREHSGHWLAHSPLVTGGLVAVAVFCAAHVALRLQPPSVNIALFWPATGVLVATLLSTRGQHRIAALAGACLAYALVNWVHTRSFTAGVVFNIANLVEASGIVYLLERGMSNPFRLDTLKAVAQFTMTVVAVIAAVGLAVAIVLKLIGHATAPLQHVWQVWFLSDAVGALTVGPWLIAMGGNEPQRTSARGLPGEQLVNLLAVALTSYVILGRSATSQQTVTLAIVLIYPLIVWLVARGTLVSAAAGLLTIALAVFWHTTHGAGIFAGDEVAGQIYLIAMATSVLTLSAIMHENRMLLEASRDSEFRLRIALDSAKAGIHTWHIDSGVMEWDGVVRAQWGLPAAVPVTYGAFIEGIHPEYRLAVKEALDRALDPAGHGDFFAEFRVRGGDAMERWISATGKVVFDNGRPLRLIGTTRDVSERKANEQHIRVLMREVSHRSKNLLAVTQVIARQTATSAESVEEFERRFSARLRGLAASQDLLVAHHRSGVPFSELVRSQLDHYAELTGTRIHIEPCDVPIEPAAAQSLGMALHELSTNAAKYGALSNDAGKIFIGCRIEDAPSGPVMVISWSETGGPVVTAPKHAGFGSVVIDRLLKQRLEGKVEITFAPEGLRWQFSVPLENVSDVTLHSAPP